MFQWNILNYGRIHNNVRVQDARFWAMVANYQNTVLRANAEVEDGLATFLRALRNGPNCSTKACPAQNWRSISLPRSIG